MSPYPFKTAQEHYAALLAETTKRRGAGKSPSAEQLADWTGRYAHPAIRPTRRPIGRVATRAPARSPTGIGSGHNQFTTILSLLTPEYQKRMVQEAYHQANTNAPQWPSQYCWPEGFMRRWHEFAVWEWHIIAAPSVVQIVTGVARNFITTIHVGRESSSTATYRAWARMSRAGTARRSASGTATR